MLKDSTPKIIRLKDYKRPDYTISSIHLTFQLDDSKTQVTSVMQVNVNSVDANCQAPLVLNGEELLLKSIQLDGAYLSSEDYLLANETLTIKNVPEKFTLKIVNEINPAANKALDGLYKSGNIFCSQNEPQGFRRITYYLDRPDVMAKFTTKIIADKTLYPVLLSNGNPVDAGDLADGKHFVTWQDPFPKPCYLYALVAGDLALIKDEFITQSGRKIDLRIYCDKGNESKCGHAMTSLKNSMKWDEDFYGREYDLDIFMIVAVDSFNMGAMENKGLNIFNSAYVLANPQTATDQDFLGIEAVVGHEYFHNWTGNRITCRDWFQLTLKEGLTVFRDQEFSAAMNSPVVKRIDDVHQLQSHQFVEDAGPTSHPIKPESYMEINNFYTMTIYEKGAEVIRMIHTLLGKENYRKGTDKYFALYDGQAVTTEDFLFAMSSAYPWGEKSRDKFNTQFKFWYSQAGTPILKVATEYCADTLEYSMTFTQTCPASAGQTEKQAYFFPLSLGLVNPAGEDLTLALATASALEQPQLEAGILHLSEASQTFTFKNIGEMPIPSINRAFSAPIKVEAALSVENLAFLMANDNDGYNQFAAGQELGIRLLKGMIKDRQAGVEFKLHPAYIEAMGRVIKDKALDHAFKAQCLLVPTEEILLQEQVVEDYQTTYLAREFVLATLADVYREELLELYDELGTRGEFSLSAEAMGKRALQNRVLGILMCLSDQGIDKVCFEHFSKANNMTDELCGLINLSHKVTNYSQQAIESFYHKWKHETLVMQKWLAVQAAAPLTNTLERVRVLLKDPVYDANVPNLFRSVVGTFCRNNTQFHAADGQGHQFIADQILMIDKINPQMASSISGAFKQLGKLPPQLKILAQKQLQRVLSTEGLSKNSYEIVSKILANN